MFVKRVISKGKEYLYLAKHVIDETTGKRRQVTIRRITKEEAEVFSNDENGENYNGKITSKEEIEAIWSEFDKLKSLLLTVSKIKWQMP